MLSTKIRRTLGLILAGLLLAACEGPTGPEGARGPEGPQGPQGPEGEPATLHVQEAVVGSSGTATVVFAGLQVEEAVVTCYLSDTEDGPWLIIGTDLTGAICGAGNDGPDLLVSVVGAPAGWFFMATAATGGDG